MKKEAGAGIAPLGGDFVDLLQFVLGGWVTRPAVMGVLADYNTSAN